MDDSGQKSGELRLSLSLATLARRVTPRPEGAVAFACSLLPRFRLISPLASLAQIPEHNPLIS
jgi:hypothetical protein